VEAGGCRAGDGGRVGVGVGVGVGVAEQQGKDGGRAIQGSKGGGVGCGGVRSGWWWWVVVAVVCVWGFWGGGVSRISRAEGVG